MDFVAELKECCRIMMLMSEDEFKVLKKAVDATDQPLAHAIIIEVQNKKEGS